MARRAPQAPCRLEIYDKNFRRVGSVGDPRYLTVIPRFNVPGQMRFGVNSDHRYLDKLLAPGAHVRVVDEDDRHVMSGWVNGFAQSGPERSSFLDFDVTDHLAVLRYVLGWVVPGSPITGQGSAGSNWTMTGRAETVLKAAVKANAVDRLGLPIQIPTTLGRGADVTARLRFQPLYDRLFPVVDGAGIEKSGIGVEMQLVPGYGLKLEIYTPTVRPQPLTEQSGIIADWRYSFQEANATRGVAGGQGEATLRVFRTSSLAALETEIGWKREIWRDARDSADATVLYQRLQESYVEHGRKAGFSVGLLQTPRFRYGGAQGLRVGDTISLEVGGRKLTDTLTEATLSWTREKGWESRPRVGEISDSTDAKIMKFIRSIARGIQTRNTER